MSWYLEALRKYVTFSGRARRKEYWMFNLFNVLIAVALAFVEGLVGFAPESETSLFAGLYFLAVFIPGWAVLIRRLHDTGRSGWWWLITLIPLLGAIALLVFLVQDSEPGKNQYGPNPKESESEWKTAAFAEL